MNTFRFAITILSVFLYIPMAKAKMGATEWGTFTSLIGSNGKTQNGMYHEDEELPSFVHGFGELVSQPIFQFPRPNDPRCPRHSKIPCDYIINNFISQKMETPVIYFYTGIDTEFTVDVKFPEGAVTETFPGPVMTVPHRASQPVLANGHTIFKVKAHAMDKTPSLLSRLPIVPTGNIYEHARLVNASVVQANDEMEKFIFYRGVGRFTPRLSILSTRGTLTMHQCSDCGQIPAMFLIDVDHSGHGKLLDLGAISPNGNKFVPPTDIAGLRDHSGPGGGVTGVDAERMLLSGLETAGLNNIEARAMLETWKHGYLKVPGLRVLYVLPREEIDAILPVTITPEVYFSRVFVGRIEVMLDTDENALLRKVLAARDLIDVSRLGRFAESMLRRILEVYIERGPTTEQDLELIQRLIERARTLHLN